MALGTTETISSIALAMVPPGNIVRSISELRMALWTMMGASSARAYFDYPVLAWLAQPIDGAALAGLASRLRLPFELTSLEMVGSEAFLRFPAESASVASALADLVPIAGSATAWLPGPFTAGIGVYCATLSQAAPPSSAELMALLKGQVIRTKTYLLAQLELCWEPEPSLQSSWATLSSARSSQHAR